MRRIIEDTKEERREVDEKGVEHFYRKAYFDTSDPERYCLIIMYSKLKPKAIDDPVCQTCG